jgi:Na+/H+ antiporter NhaD/arsenite permease-like protein
MLRCTVREWLNRVAGNSMSKSQHLLLGFVFREWLLTIAVLGLLLSSLYLGSVPTYTLDEITPLFFLLVLFVVVRGIERSGLISRLGTRLEKGRFLPARLVIITFFLSMFLTIDVSLVTMIPLVLSLNIRQRSNLVILVALTAHVGAALMPFGTPQNLFIFSFYGVDPHDFIVAIAPFSVGMLAVFLACSLLIRPTSGTATVAGERRLEVRSAVAYGLLLVLVVLCIFRVLPPQAALVAIAYPLLFDRRSLAVDYVLLATFLCFIGLAGNAGEIIGSVLEHPHHVFTLSAGLSQVISNVPTTLLLTEFTDHWQALLWGTNVGGFGSPVAAMANLIAYRLYASHADSENTASFMIRFIIAGYLTLMVGVGLFMLWRLFWNWRELCLWAC